MLTQLYLSFFVKRNWGFVNLQCCNYCYLPSDVSSKLQSPMTIFHHKLLTREGRVVTNGWTHPSSMTMYLFTYSLRRVIQKVTINDIKYHMTLNNIFSVLVHFEEKVDVGIGITNIIGVFTLSVETISWNVGRFEGSFYWPGCLQSSSNHS